MVYLYMLNGIFIKKNGIDLFKEWLYIYSKVVVLFL